MPAQGHLDAMELIVVSFAIGTAIGLLGLIATLAHDAIRGRTV